MRGREGGREEGRGKRGREGGREGGKEGGKERGRGEGGRNSQWQESVLGERTLISLLLNPSLEY